MNLHSAAGVGNGLGALSTAFRDHSPLVITAGQQARSLLTYDPYLGTDRALNLVVVMTIVVLNNRSYGATLAFSRLMQTSEPPGVHLPGISFEHLARGFGVECSNADRSVDIYPAIQRALAEDRPTLVNIRIDPKSGDPY